MVKISNIIFVLGMFAFLIGGILLCITPEQKIHKTVDCFDKYGSKIIGLTCIEETNDAQDGAFALVFVGVVLIMFSMWIQMVGRIRW